MILTELSASAGLLPDGKNALPPGAHTLGQADDCAVCVVHGSVSRHHARLTIADDGAMTLEDLGSTNGTFNHGVRISQPASVTPNQTITLGAADLLVQQRVASAASGVGSDMDITLPGPRPVAVAVSLTAAGLPAEIGATSRYQIERHIAQGGMGAVMGARQPSIRREVAMKVILSGADDASRMRFIEEAQITGQLEHPNIVPVHDLALDEHGQPYYTMKLVKGTNLHDVIEALSAGKEDALARYTLPVLLTVFQKVCDALAFAHSHGVIHRDLKPANIMVGEFGEVLVMDWGLAKLIQTRQTTAPAKNHARPVVTEAAPTVTSARAEQADTFATMDGYIMGTPQFMSPEQISGDPATLDGRSDVFALGAILYSLLTLQPPFTSKNVNEVLARIQRGRFTNPKALDSTSLRHLPGGRVPDSLKAVVRKALTTESWQRYQSVSAMQADLTAYQNGFATRAENAGAWRQFRLLVQRNKAASIGLAAVLLIGSTLGTKAVIEGRRAERALTDLKKSAPAMLQLAESEAGFQRFDNALEKLDAALLLDPELKSGWWRRAWMLLAQEKFAESAAAVREASRRDPANTEKLAAILPLLETLPAAPAAERWNPECSKAVLDHLNAVGAGGEAIALSSRFQLSGQDKLKLVEARVTEWLGPRGTKGSGSNRSLAIQQDGTLLLSGLSKTIDTLEPLRGLPINNLGLGQTMVTDLEPLRGMPLHTLSLQSCSRVNDLTPLRGMRLLNLTINGTQVTDLSPLAGQPIEHLDAGSTLVEDLRPLQGMPLSKLNLAKTKVRGLSPLAGMPLRILDIMSTSVGDLSPLKGMPLEELNQGGTGTQKVSLEPLRGAPLKRAVVQSEDYSPLVGVELESLTTSSPSDRALHTMAGIRTQSFRVVLGKNTSVEALKQVQLKALQIDGATGVHDLSPLRDCVGMEELTIHGCPAPIEPLRGHPTLKRLSYNRPGEPVSPLVPVEQFWADYDAQQTAGKK